MKGTIIRQTCARLEKLSKPNTLHLWVCWSRGFPLGQRVQRERHTDCFSISSPPNSLISSRDLQTLFTSMRTNERPCLGNFFDICFFFFLPCSSPFSREITVLPYTLLLVSRGFSYRQTKCLLVREQRCSKPPPQARAGASVRERCFIVHTVSLQFLFYYFSR